jgi:sulfur carrier protein
MEVVVNGEERSLEPGTTVADLVATLGAPADGRGVAVAIDTEIVPRSSWGATRLLPGARVEVLIAVQGG